MEERNRLFDSLVNQLEKPIPLSGSTSSRLSLVVQQELVAIDPDSGIHLSYLFSNIEPLGGRYGFLNLTRTGCSNK
jgi:hypothetical protein